MLFIGVAIRFVSAIVFLLGIISCLFSFKIGIIMIVSGVLFWNIGAKVLKLSEFDEDAIKDDKIEEEKVHQQTFYQPIDYSAIPYDLSVGWKSSDNKFQALTDISYMNDFLREARKLGNIKQKLEICTEEILFDGEGVSTLEKLPNTKTGKVPKYIAKLNFTTRSWEEFEPQEHYFGDIYYMQDGTIGKACLVCWIRKKMYCIHIGLVGTSLVIKKIETNTSKSVEKEIIYKR